MIIILLVMIPGGGDLSKRCGYGGGGSRAKFYQNVSTAESYDLIGIST